MINLEEFAEKRIENGRHPFGPPNDFLRERKGSQTYLDIGLSIDGPLGVCLKTKFLPGSDSGHLLKRALIGF
jgi:hypothetical protein